MNESLEARPRRPDPRVEQPLAAVDDREGQLAVVGAPRTRDEEPDHRSSGLKVVLEGLLWAWVIGVLLAYLWQFESILPSVLGILF